MTQTTRHLERFFADDGTLARTHPGFEPREGQVELARAVLNTLQHGGHLVAEAGTGTGKTLAYLVPAILRGQRVIVSTGTRNLQDQLADKDLPFLSEDCRMPVSACVLKGRDNYLCRHRFAHFNQAPTLPDPAERRAWPEVVRFAEETLTGDRAELVGLPENPTFWPEVSAKESTCLGRRCPEFDDCHLQELRRQARESQLVIVNHHLFLADAALREGAFGSILPDAALAVFDEAHRLEDAATSFFARSISNWRLRELADDSVRELGRTDIDLPILGQRARELAEAAAALPEAWSQQRGRQVLPARLKGAQEDAIRRVRVGSARLGELLSDNVEHSATAEALARRSEQVVSDLEFLEARGDSSWVYWSETRGRGLILSATPVDVSSLLWERVFSRLKASVLCSATLAIDGSMNHVRSRLGLDAETARAVAAASAGDEHDGPGPGSREEEDELVVQYGAVEEDEPGPPPEHEHAGWEEPFVEELIVSSPFDHASQGLLYLPPRMPEPRSNDFAVACAEHAKELVEASRGRAFLLFTSHGNLRLVHEMLRDDLDYPLHVQGEAPRGELLRRFQEEAGSVLMATASFWEGVDVPGEALSLVVIDKLPFAVPSDPIVAARCRLIEEAGGSAFGELSLPTAVLTLKQGAGRLLRSRSDRGVVALLDPRLTGSRYGRTFLANLPPFRHVRDLDEVRRFFADETVDDEWSDSLEPEDGPEDDDIDF
ncbi:MAG: ATP-dependent DNA helicase [Acidobacteriota bacterium]